MTVGTPAEIDALLKRRAELGQLYAAAYDSSDPTFPWDGFTATSGPAHEEMLRRVELGNAIQAEAKAINAKLDKLNKWTPGEFRRIAIPKALLCLAACAGIYAYSWKAGEGWLGLTAITVGPLLTAIEYSKDRDATNFEASRK